MAPDAAETGGGMKIALIVLAVAALAGAAVLLFRSGGQTDRPGPSGMMFQCAACGNQWMMPIDSVAKQIESGGSTSMDCPKCRQSRGLQMLHCPKCGQYFLPEWRRTGGRPGPNVCPGCGTDMNQWQGGPAQQ